MSEVKIIQGEIFQDHRGQISSLNEFHFDGVKRCYVIHHPDRAVVRGWNGHQREKKWFYCIKGSFALGLVEIDNWDSPSANLKAEIYELSDCESKIICVPEGYANCIKAREDGSILLVLSDKSIEEASNDSWKYDSLRWVDWSKY